MKNQFRRVLSLMLCMVLLFSLSYPALADTPSVVSTEFQDVKKTSADYVLTVGDGSDEFEYPVGRVDISFANAESVAAVLNDNRIPQEVKDHIARRYTTAVEEGNTNITMVYFSQELLPQTRGWAEPEYRTINGTYMRTDRLYETGIPAEKRIASGQAVAQVLGSLSDLTLLAAGMAGGVSVSLTASGISLLQILINKGKDDYVTGSRDDYIDIKITYDCVTQWTYASIGSDWQLGLVSQKGTITQIEYEVYTYSEELGGNTEKDSRNVTATHKSESFSSPWNKAYQNLNSPVEEWVRARINGVYIYF